MSAVGWPPWLADVSIKPRPRRSAVSAGGRVLPSRQVAERRPMPQRSTMRIAPALLLSLVCATLTACQSTAPQEDRPSAGGEPTQAAPPDLGEDRRQAADWVEAEQFAAAGQWRSAVAALARAWRDAADRQALNDRLWRLTAAAPANQAAALAQREVGELAAVWSLRTAMNAAFSTSEKANRLDAWLGRQPRHPLAAPLPRSLALLRRRPPPSTRVGLFAPLSGPLAAAGEALRDGFFSAYLQDSASAKPEVRLYDTAAEDIQELYQRSRNDDVTFIVGPLDRSTLQGLIDLAPETPVLGLNYLSDPSQQGFGPAAGGGTNPPEAAMRPNPGIDTDSAEASQQQGQSNERQGVAEGATLPQRPFRTLGLAIEDEAATIGRRLLTDGLERVLVVRNSEEWALRGADALAESWPHHLEQQGFATIGAITDALGEALQVTASEARHEALEELLGDELQFLPRARADIDGVVAFVNHLQALALAAAVKFHFTEELPIYASSQSVRNASTFAELEGFNVAEMPFRLSSGPLNEALAKGFRLDSGNLVSLFALGIDAYRLFDHWPLLAATQALRGATGILTPGEDGRIGRCLAWATVADGRLRTLPESAECHAQPEAAMAAPGGLQNAIVEARGPLSGGPATPGGLAP